MAKKSLTVAVQLARRRPASVQRYLDGVTSRLANLGLNLKHCHYGEVPPGSQVIWQPGLLGGSPPKPTPRLPLVVTLHGVGRFDPTERKAHDRRGAKRYLDVADRRVRWMRWLVRKGSCFAVVTVSNLAKDHIARHLPIEEEKIHVVPHGVDSTVFYPERSDVTDHCYLLHVSSGAPVKNVPALVESFRRASVAPVRLVVVAPKLDFRLDGVEGVDLISQWQGASQLRTMYANALGFLFPSLKETFGLPILEAMACGCPTLTSRGTACEEVAGGAAILVDPTSVSSITDGISRLVDDPLLRSQMRSRGLARAQELTWEKAALSYERLFRAALDASQ